MNEYHPRGRAVPRSDPDPRAMPDEGGRPSAVEDPGLDVVGEARILYQHTSIVISTAM